MYISTLKHLPRNTKSSYQTRSVSQNQVCQSKHHIQFCSLFSQTSIACLSIIRNFLKYKGVQAFLGGIRPCVVGLILATALTMLMSTLFAFKSIDSEAAPDAKGLIIFAVIAATAVIYKRIKEKPLSPILLILLSAGLGMVMYSI